MVTVLVKRWPGECRGYWKVGQREPIPSRLPVHSSPRVKVYLVTGEDLTWGGTAFAPQIRICGRSSGLARVWKIASPCVWLRQQCHGGSFAVLHGAPSWMG